MTTTPTVEELRAKARACFDEAEQFTHPDLKQKMIEIGLEYERLAKRAEAYVANPSELALRKWYP